MFAVITLKFKERGLSICQKVANDIFAVYLYMYLICDTQIN